LHDGACVLLVPPLRIEKPACDLARCRPSRVIVPRKASSRARSRAASRTPWPRPPAVTCWLRRVPRRRTSAVAPRRRGRGPRWGGRTPRLQRPQRAREL